MVRIRLRRTGLKGQPSYRLVVADKESPRDGRFLEIVDSTIPALNRPRSTSKKTASMIG